MKKILVIAWILVLALQLMPLTASAEEPYAPTKLWVAPSETNGIPVQIDVFKAKTGGTSYNPIYTYQLYLPGDADLENCFLSWDGSLQATVDNMTYSSGSCPIPPVDTQKAYTFINGNQTTTLNIITYQGAPDVQRVFIVIDENYVEDGETQPHTIAAMDGDPDHEKYCVGEIYINGMYYELTKMNGRGNATWKEADDKRPYNITLGKKINFPGVDSEKTKKWSLLAENLDHSLLGNRSGYWLAYELGIGQDTTSADVWMNGEYQGCYTVTPKTDSFVPNDGFMIEQDNYQEKPVSEGGDPQFKLDGLVSHVENPTWTSSYNLITVKKMGDGLLLNDGVVDESPENMEAAAGRIRIWLQEAWDAIRSDTGRNAQGKYYTDYIDIESFAKMYLMHEYVKSYDVCAGSIYFHRDGQGENDKLIAGPLWDLDNAMGSTYNNSYLVDASDRRSAQGDFILNIGNYQNYGSEYKTSIYKTLSKHEDFMEEVIYQYNKHRAFFVSLPDDFDSMSDEIEASAKMNHYKVNDLGHGTGKDNHYYRTQTTLGSSPYQQTYLAISNSKTDWDKYVQNMWTYISVRSVWFHDNYFDPDYIDPADCTHEYQVIETHAATCTSSGSITYKCPLCRDVKTEALAQLPHDYQDGKCVVCQDRLINVSIVCVGGASITVYETQDITGPCIENATLTHPRNSSTGLIDGSGNGQVNFIVNLQPGYAIADVAVAPESSYNNLRAPADTGIENGYRVTKVSGDLTITVAITGSVSFNPNGGAGTMEDQSIILGRDQGLRENEFNRDGYTFAGWNTTADGSGTAYASTVNLSENTTLYAQWTPIIYNITYELDGGTSAENPESYTVESEDICLNAPVKERYTFAGWRGTGLTEPAMEVIIPRGSVGNRSYSATWTINQYNVTFNPNDGSGTMATQTVPENVPTPLTPCAFTRTGYIFTGWNSKADGSGTAYGDEGNITLTEDLTLYAQWKSSLAITEAVSDKHTAIAGDTITWTAAASGGSAPLRYCFYVYKDGARVFSSGYTSANSISYIPDAAGTYSAKAFVKDGAGSSASLMGESVAVTETAPLSIADVTADKTTAIAGDTITWTAAASGGSAPLRYCFYVYKNGTKVVSSGYTSASSISYIPDAAGTYSAKAFVKDAASSTANLMGDSVAVTETVPLSVTDVTADKTTAIVGDTITWTAAASGGSAPLRYCFYVYKNGTKVFSSGYTSAKSISYTPDAAGTYSAKAFVRDAAGSTANLMGDSVAVTAAVPLSITDVTADKLTSDVGDTITWTAVASGGSAPLRYCFYVYKNGARVFSSGYTSASSISYIPDAAGTYSAKAFVRDAAGSTTNLMGDSVAVTAAAPLSVTDVTADKLTADVGDTITWTAVASGGSAPLRYCFYVYKGGTKVFSSGYTSASSISYIPDAAGTYLAKAFVRDAAGSTTNLMGDSVAVTAAAPLSVTGVWADKLTADVGETVTWTAAADGGSGAYLYCFYIYKNGTVVYKSGYGAASSIAYTADTAGSYTAKAFVKDSVGARDSLLIAEPTVVS